MLKINDLARAVDFARAVGERPYGHFDHDANLLSGPLMRHKEGNSTRKKKETNKNNAAISSNSYYESYMNEKNGEILYRIKKKT